ncbi:MAG: lipoyl(octanoyl) transferase LipB [Deltaproteobacteria bacterium]|jgi:lipoyl(octanoyl) transferase|nr:lipoyl(octanoyl) transferase LipB [Deltaproteobacteria bacterium]
MPERIVPGSFKKKHLAIFQDLGVLEYKKALELQIRIQQEKIDKIIEEDYLFFVEHQCVFTLGRRGGKENLTVSKKFLSAQNIDIIQTNRGGNITYHCPGQAVMYPVIDLEKNKIGVKDFVYGLEEIMKLTANDYDINADRNKKNNGIWVGNAKLGSVGIAIKRGISMHGLALNINPDLEPFSWINPCGLSDISITSIGKEKAQSKSMGKNYDFSMDRIKNSFIKHFSSVFDYIIR